MIIKPERMKTLKTVILAVLLSSAVLGATAAGATGLATCDSGPRDTWQPQENLEKMLGERGWKIRRIKEDGGCYEVYAFDEKGERVEAYFHPRTLALVPTSRYPR
jgi:hypothetical protein